MEQNALTYIVGLAVFCLGLLSIAFLIAVVIYRQRQNNAVQEQVQQQQFFELQLNQSRVETQEETFALIGKELHDNIGQLIISAKALISLAEQKSSAEQKEILQTTNLTLGDAVHEIRTLSKILDKNWLAQFSLVSNIKHLTEQIKNVVQLNIDIDRIDFDQYYTAEEQLLLYRVIQEAIQNAIKHGNSKQIIVRSEKSNQEIYIFIIDDGKGFELTFTGSGILNIQHRIKALQGYVQWTTHHPKGTQLKITLPIRHHEK